MRGISKWEGKERLRAPTLFESRAYGGGGSRTTCKGKDVCNEWLGSGEGVLFTLQKSNKREDSGQPG
jgi:hypothetical protein